MIDVLSRVVFIFCRWRLLAKRRLLIRRRLNLVVPFQVEPDFEKKVEDLSLIDYDPEAEKRYDQEKLERARRYNARREKYSPWCGFIYCHTKDQYESMTRKGDIGVALKDRSGCNHTKFHAYKKPFHTRDVFNLVD